MLKLIICLVVEACLCVWFAFYVPRAFFQIVKRLENGAEDEKKKITRNAFGRCKDEISTLGINVTLGAGLCVVFLLVNGLRRGDLFTVLFLLGFFCSWFLHFKLRKFVEPIIEKYMRESGKIDLVDRGTEGALIERWISMCFVVPYFSLLYQGLTLLIA